MKLVKIINTDGLEHFVNPEYVTSIVREKFETKSWTKVWVVGHAGYGTFGINTDEDAGELAKRLQVQSK